jgi:hypothetical protein
MAANTEFRRGDSDNDLLRKILTSLGLGGATDSALDALLTELQSGLGGKMAVVNGEFTRPNDSTPYAANDVVGNGAVVTFTNVGDSANGSGYVTNVRLVKSTATITNAVFRLWLYATAPTPIADNAQFTLLWANRAARLGYVDLACTTEGTGSDSASAFVTNVNLKFMCAGGSRNLFGVLEAKQAYTPGASESFYIELTVDQN